jgi:hypothetical protein
MKKTYFNLLFIVLIITLLVLFLYSGLNYSERVTETMMWKSGKFKITNNTKFIGIILVLCLPTYFILKKKIFHR